MFIKCDYCHNEFERSKRQVSEAVKMRWKKFCSLDCQKRSKTTRKEYICGYQLCGKRFMREPSQILLSKIHFCSKKCSAAYYGIKSRKDHSHPCQFPGCKRVVYADNWDKRFCSPECLRNFQKLSTYSADRVIETLHAFYVEHDRIPVKDELKALYAPARHYFGTWNKAIEAVGYQPNPVMFAKHYITKDGHKCDSLAEKIVDDWLYRRQIDHKIHVPYPWKNGMSADFVIGDIYLELFGLQGEHKRYDELKKTKLELAKQYRIKILSLSLKEVYKGGLDNKLSRLNA